MGGGVVVMFKSIAGMEWRTGPVQYSTPPGSRDGRRPITSFSLEKLSPVKLHFG